MTQPNYTWRQRRCTDKASTVTHSYTTKMTWSGHRVALLYWFRVQHSTVSVYCRHGVTYTQWNITSLN